MSACAWGGKELRVSLAFSGVFFVLIHAGQNGMDLKVENLPEFIATGKQILAEANQRFATHHPELPEVTGFALALFYEPVGKNHLKDVVVGRTGTVDRSPCGAGTGALATLQAVRGDLASGEHLVVESVIGTHFDVQIIRPVEVGGHPGGIPRVRGSAYVTGFHQFILDAEDPLREGFVLR
jgi:proline racemase